jgi:hypothetical protein
MRLSAPIFEPRTYVEADQSVVVSRGCHFIQKIFTDLSSMGRVVRLAFEPVEERSTRSCQVSQSGFRSRLTAFSMRRSPSTPWCHSSMYQGGESRSQVDGHKPTGDCAKPYFRLAFSEIAGDDEGLRHPATSRLMRGGRHDREPEPAVATAS